MIRQMLFGGSLVAMLCFVGCEAQKGAEKESPAQPNATPISEDESVVTKNEKTPPFQVPNAPEGAVNFEIVGAKGAAILVNKREFRFYFLPEQNVDPTKAVSGTVAIAGSTSPPLQIIAPVPPGEYLYARTAEDVTLPVDLELNMTITSERQGKVTVTLPAEAQVTFTSDKTPEITSAGLNLKVGDDDALMVVYGKNLANSRVFLRKDGVEKEIPLDVNTDTEAATLDPSMSSLFEPGEWDVIIRNSEGEAVLPKGIVKQ